jgi:hypothetical protein
MGREREASTRNNTTGSRCRQYGGAAAEVFITACSSTMREAAEACPPVGVLGEPALASGGATSAGLWAPPMTLRRSA